MANRVAQLLLVARFCTVVSAVAALGVHHKIHNASGSFGGIHVTAVRYSFLALSCLAPGYAMLLLVQGIGMLGGLAIPLPDDVPLCALVLVIDWVLAFTSFCTGAAAMSVIHTAGKWRYFVPYVASTYLAYGILAVASGTWAYLTFLCEAWLAVGHRFRQQH